MKNETQYQIVRAVAAAGEINGWTDDQLAARQLLALLAATCEALEQVNADDLALWLVVDGAKWMGRQMRAVLEDKSAFDGATVNLCMLRQQFGGLVVPAAVLAHALGVDDMMRVSVNKAKADAERGVR